MVVLDWNAKVVSTDLPSKSPKLSNKLHINIPPTPFRGVTNVSPHHASDSACSEYEHYLRRPELRKLWTSKDFPGWKTESVMKPALQSLEITFRFVSTVLSDPRPYANQREWKRRLESLATSQIELIATLCEDEAEDPEIRGTVPIVDLRPFNSVVARNGSYSEVWTVPGESTVVNRVSEASLLPRLATWHKSEDVAQKIMYSIEFQMRRCPYTLGLGEPNLLVKPNLDYDAVCRPNDVHSLKKNTYDHVDNHENQAVYKTLQILESWIQVAKQIIKRVEERIKTEQYDKAVSDCYLLERIWKLLTEIEDLHLIMDPDDFLRLKNLLLANSSDETEAFCFRSRALVEMTKSCKDLRHKVPEILGVEVDPKGGPRVQEAAMKLYRDKEHSGKISLLQGLQTIESALKRFYYAYKQVLVVAMGSLEANGGNNAGVLVSTETSDSLSQLFLDPTYFPSLDAAKTFLGEFWSREQQGGDAVAERLRSRRNR